MKLPYLNDIAVSRDGVDVFGGYNHRLRIADGELYDMTNLTSEHYPVLSAREPRGVYARPAACTSLTAKDKLCYADGSEFVIGDERVEMGLSDEPKQLISMGAYVVIMPDKKYINTADISDRGDIEANFTSSGEASFTICREDGEIYEQVVAARGFDVTSGYSNEAFIWFDPSSEPHAYRQYYSSSAMWMEITVYVRIECDGIGACFKVGDGVSISGIGDTALAGLNGELTVTACAYNYIVVAGSFEPEQIDDELEGAVIGSVVRTISDSFTVSRSMPVMDYIIERGNRLWGCRYGLSASGEFVNEIYVSKAGDFKNWNAFAGLASDSYVMSVGSDGPFTGAVSYGDCAIFFKEHCMHKVYGKYPSEFQSADIICEGVMSGCHGSLAAVGGILYYMSRTGIQAYDGSLPVCVSDVFGDTTYHDAVGCAHESKYYVSMRDNSEEWQLFVYDTRHSLWHREDNLCVESFASLGGELYMLSGGMILTVGGSGERYEGTVKWSAQTGLLCVDSPEWKYISRLNIRISPELDSTIWFYIEYDSSGKWEYICTIQGHSLRSFTVPIRPRRCDHMRLRIDGEGGAKVFSIIKTIEEGSDI